jgi:hypothetical protein
VYAGVAIADKRIVAMHAALQVVLNPAEERSVSTVKPKKGKRPTVWPKTAVGIVKPIHLQKTWMILLQQALCNGLCCRCRKKIRYIFAPAPGAAVIFAVEWVKLSAIFLAVAMGKIFFRNFSRR